MTVKQTTGQHGLRHAVTLALRGAFVDPVRTGRPRIEGLPMVVGISSAAALTLIVLTLLWRLLSPILPDPVTSVGDATSQIVAILIVSIGGHLASHGLRWRWRIPLWGFLTLLHLVAAIALVLGLVDASAGAVVTLLVLGLVGNVLLLIGTVLGVRRPGSPWSVTLVLVALALNLAPALFTSFTTTIPGVRESAPMLFMLLILLPALALALAGSVSLASLSVNISQWSTLGFRDVRRPRSTRIAWMATALIGLVGGGLAWWLEGLEVQAAASNGAVLMAGLVFAWLALKLASRRTPQRHAHPSDLAEHLAEIAMPLGVLLGIVGVVVPGIASLVWMYQEGIFADQLQAVQETGTYTVHDLSESDLAQIPSVVTAANIAHIVAGIVITAVMLIAARRGRVVTTAMLGPVAICFVAAGVIGTHERWELSQTVLATLLGVVVAAAVLATRNRLDERGWTLALMAQSLCALWPWYPMLLEPLGILSDGQGLVVLIVGLLWFLITEAEYVNATGDPATRGSRLMLFCAHTGTLVLFAFLVDDTLGASYWETFDISLLTVAIPLAVIALLGLLARRHIDPDPRIAAAEARSDGSTVTPQELPHDR